MGVEPTQLNEIGGRRIASSPDVVGADLVDGSADHSLVEDIEALIADGKTYVEAELAFQKSRASFALGSVKTATIYGLGALAFVHLALIALVVGTVIALVPLIGAWLATVAVTGVLLLGAFIMLNKVKASVGDLGSVFGDKE